MFLLNLFCILTKFGTAEDMHTEREMCKWRWQPLLVDVWQLIIYRICNAAEVLNIVSLNWLNINVIKDKL